VSEATPIAPWPISAVRAGATWIIDLDGVIWLSGEPIGDAPGAIARLARAGIRVVFVTNNSEPTIETLTDRLGRAGISSSPDDIITSAEAVASLMQPGETAHVMADGGVHEALAARGVTESRDGPVDAAVIGWTHDFDFEQLASISASARESNRLLATNEDPVHPTPSGLLPGTGALLAAVVAASGVMPSIAGKPHDPMVELVRVRVGLGAGGPPALVVGDQPCTDGRLAERLGLPFALVDSGVTQPGTPVDGVPVAARAEDFAGLVDRLSDDADQR
jgi:HAD superfamily hydrolase (TIGR01450 family)